MLTRKGRDWSQTSLGHPYEVGEMKRVARAVIWLGYKILEWGYDLQEYAEVQAWKTHK